MKIKNLKQAVLFVSTVVFSLTAAATQATSSNTLMNDPTLRNWRLEDQKSKSARRVENQRIDRNLEWKNTPLAEAQELKTDTKYLVALNGAMLAFMNSLPREVVNWADDPRSAFDIWEDNSRKTPHFDSDSWMYNYVAHPLAGASYYRVCRDKGFSFGECYVYSFLISTFVWEYGFESTRERPSIQDLIITPTGGALLGELMTKLSEEIDENDGRVLGSRAAGRIVKGLLNPIGTTIQNIRAVMDPIADELNADTFIRYGISRSQRFDSLAPGYDQHSRSRIEFGVRFKLAPGWEQKSFN